MELISLAQEQLHCRLKLIMQEMLYQHLQVMQHWYIQLLVIGKLQQKLISIEAQLITQQLYSLKEKETAAMLMILVLILKMKYTSHMTQPLQEMLMIQMVYLLLIQRAALLAYAVRAQFFHFLIRMVEQIPSILILQFCKVMAFRLLQILGLLRMELIMRQQTMAMYQLIILALMMLKMSLLV